MAHQGDADNYLEETTDEDYLMLIEFNQEKDQVRWFSYASIITILLYILFYQIGLGPIPYFIGSELFEVGPRPAAMALGSIASWGCNFIVAMLFTTLQSAWGAFVFLPFTVTCVLLTILLKIYLPETRRRHISSIVPLVSNGFRSKPLVPWSYT